MTQQKAFYEIERPAKKRYFVVVQEDTTTDEAACAAANCKTNADAAEYTDALGNVDIDVFQCDICGQWFCIVHIDLKHDLCTYCANLPVGIREEIIAFREELNR